jgi:hypothetical protein
MKHLDEWQIQRFLDGELDPASRDTVQTHLQRCPECQNALRAVQETVWAIRSTRPSLESLPCGPEFWHSLTQHLPKIQATTLPWLSLLPPFLLGLLGTSVSLLISGTYAAHALENMGLMPPMGSHMADRMAQALASPLLEDGLYDRLGWSGDQVSRSFISLWDQMNQSTNRGAGFLMILSLLGLLFSSIVMLHLFWVVCLVRSDGGVLTGRAHRGISRDRKGG